MQSLGFYVSGQVILYLFVMVVGMAIINACDRLPECVSPFFLTPHSVGNELLLSLSFFLMYFGFFGIVALMVPGVDADLSIVYAICAGMFSLAVERK